MNAVLALAQLMPPALFVALCLVVCAAFAWLLWLACEAWAAYRSGYYKRRVR